MMRTGIDIEQVKRFVNRDKAFLNFVFSAQELTYCFSKTFPEQHLCGIYCAKEALFKALSGLIQNLNYTDFTVLHDQFGAPFVTLPPKLGDLRVGLSISHTSDYAVASVVLYNIPVTPLHDQPHAN